jgi:hypothetical protein
MVVVGERAILHVRESGDDQQVTSAFDMGSVAETI